MARRPVPPPAGSHRVKDPRFITDGRRRVLVVVLVLASAVCLGVGLYGPSTAKAAGRGRSLATPVWSARRVPEPIVDLVSATRLQTQLDAELAGTDACVMVNGSAGTVASRLPAQPLAPASTVKLLTATAALGDARSRLQVRDQCRCRRAARRGHRRPSLARRRRRSRARDARLRPRSCSPHRVPAATPPRRWPRSRMRSSPAACGA